MTATPRRIAAALALLMLTVIAQADVLKIPVGSQPNASGQPLPPKGMLMQRVRAGWGEPEVALDPVGQPPITRWDYADFSVYFEYEHVVHTVARHRPDPATPAQERTGSP
jgi:hypothetical protein